jgi:hypothetical protein
MTEESRTAQETQPKKKLSREEKQVAHVGRIARTTVACVAGLLAGVLSFLLAGPPGPAGIQQGASAGILLLALGIAVQKPLFTLLRVDGSSLTAKDWFFQGFMTFALWFISWTVLLSSTASP